MNLKCQGIRTDGGQKYGRTSIEAIDLIVSLYFLYKSTELYATITKGFHENGDDFIVTCNFAFPEKRF